MIHMVNCIAETFYQRVTFIADEKEGIKKNKEKLTSISYPYHHDFDCIVQSLG